MTSEQEVEEIADRYLSEQGTETQLLKFFERYAGHIRKSTKCILDGRYFYKVLAPYRGLVASEMYIRINLGGQVSLDNGKSGQQFWMGLPVFDLEELKLTESSQRNPRYRLIKLIIDISNDPDSNLGSVHSNLLCIDTWKKQIVRFEPMRPTEHTDPINTILETYFQQSHILPNYSFRLLDEHPQLATTESCPSKGMCAAYVLKKAMMYVTDHNYPLNRDPDVEEQKILVFADAIETEYGNLPEENDALSLSVDPVNSHVTPKYYGNDWVHPPEYYGYRPHARFARPWGWGWTHGNREQRSSLPASQQEYITHKMDLGWNRCREKASVINSNTSHEKDEEELAERRRLMGTETGDPESFYDPEYLRKIAALRRESNQNRTGWKPIASTGVYAGDKFAAGTIQSQKSWGQETGCGCDGCHMAPPRDEYGYWDRDEEGGRVWQSMGSASNQDYSHALRTQGEVMHRSNDGPPGYEGLLGGHRSDKQVEEDFTKQRQQYRAQVVQNAPFGGVAEVAAGAEMKRHPVKHWWERERKFYEKPDLWETAESRAEHERAMHPPIGYEGIMVANLAPVVAGGRPVDKDHEFAKRLDKEQREALAWRGNFGGAAEFAEAAKVKKRPVRNWWQRALGEKYYPEVGYDPYGNETGSHESSLHDTGFFLGASSGEYAMEGPSYTGVVLSERNTGYFLIRGKDQQFYQYFNRY